MKLFPAIDLRDGQVVRLTQGDFNRMEVYSADPVEIAARFREQGATNLHVVDLDGARDGTAANFPAIREIARNRDMFIQVGGGIRDKERIQKYLELGVNRVILGTIAVQDFDFLGAMLEEYGNRIAVGVDARDGKIAVKGWKEITRVDSLDFCRRLDKAGVSTIIYTDISRDGAMQGTNLELYQTLSQQLGLDIIASGGISSKEEMMQLADMKIYGAIVGKALYTGALDLKELIALC